MKNLFIKTPIMCLVFVLLASLTTIYMIPVNAEAEGFKIGIVDISGVFEKYEKRKDMDQQLKDMEKEFQNEINKKRDTPLGASLFKPATSFMFGFRPFP